jgi:hypothetical protein
MIEGRPHNSATGAPIVDISNGSSSSSGSGSSSGNYTTRYTYDPTTNLLSYVTRTQGAVTEIQNYVRDATGTLLGIDAWVAI